MRIFFLHGWTSVPGGLKPSYLRRHGHTVWNPKLPDDDFDQSVRIAEAEYQQQHPAVVVGSSRGGAVAMNIDSSDTPLVLLCPAWKNWGAATTVKPNTIILHSRNDDVIPFADSEELLANSGLSPEALIEVGNDHRLADPEPLQAMLEACEKLAGNPGSRGFHCRTCGQYHSELPMEFGADAPAVYYDIPAGERASRCELTSDLCMIDEQQFFVRGCLELSVIDGNQPFIWGVWASLSKENFQRTFELWEQQGREAEPPYFGWLSTSLPLYPETLHLKTRVHTRPLGQRPFIELQPTDHPLAVEQRTGITMARVREIAEALLH